MSEAHAAERLSYFAPSAAVAVAAVFGASAPPPLEPRIERAGQAASTDSAASVTASAASAQVSASPLSATSDADAASASFAAADDDAPMGPSEEEESAYLAEVNGFGGAEFVGGFSASQAAEPEDEITGPLPSLAALQEKIPPATLALLDELFRAKFTRVERIRTKDLKP